MITASEVRPYDELLAAIIRQAAQDFRDCYAPCGREHSAEHFLHLLGVHPDRVRPQRYA